MIFDYNKMESETLENLKGGEKHLDAKMYFDGKNRFMKGKLCAGASIGMHRHEGNCEMFYILEGEGKVIYDGKEERISEGMAHYCPEGHTHSLVNDSNSDLVFFAVIPKQ